MSAFSILEQNTLNFDLMPISARELLYLEECPCDVYALENGLYDKILGSHSHLSQQQLIEIITKYQGRVFVLQKERYKLVQAQQDNLRNLTRSLSMGDPVEKGSQALNLLTINLDYLYKAPTNDDILNLHFQSLKNIYLFLADNQKIQDKLYADFKKKKHFYIYEQPMIASLFTLGVFANSHLFAKKEVENLFITSYLKDIGMSAIPVEKYHQEELSDDDKKIFAEHPRISVEILKGRVKLSQQYLNIIEKHHYFSLMQKETKTKEEMEEDTQFIVGTETMIISVLDIIAAMIAGRPYQKASTLFESLELIKVLIGPQYPAEFKLIVNYFKNFFKIGA